MIDISERSSDITALLERAPGKRPRFLEDGALDHMFAMIMELASQLWVMRERLYCCEALLDEAGVLDGKSIEDWTADAAQSAELAQMREDMLRDLFRTVLARDPNAQMPDHTNDPSPPC